MMHYEFHFLRPQWLWATVPVLLMGFFWMQQTGLSRAWQNYCDPTLLKHLLPHDFKAYDRIAKVFLLLALLFMIAALSGPTGQKLETPVYHTEHPRLILLDVSSEMLKTDLSPNRLARAKFKLHDLFKLKHNQKGQLALMVYTAEPFVVSPFTKDAKTIDALINEISPAIMPVDGINLSEALQSAEELIQQSRVSHVDVLIMTANPPDTKAIELIKKYHKNGHMKASILPMLSPKKILSEPYKQFVQAGGGLILPLRHDDGDLKTWLDESSRLEALKAQEDEQIEIWRDDGRWLLIPALLCLLPVFRKYWFSRIQA